MKLVTRKKREYDDDSLLPLVNIIFLLLIFFMIAGVIEKRIVKDDIELPAAELNRFENKEITKIFINKSNIFSINDENADINKISAYLGVRNLFNFTQESPLVDPGAGINAATNESWQAGFSPKFDTAYVYGPTRGRRYIIGLSCKW